MSHTSAWRRTIGSNRSTSPFHPERIPLLRIPGMQQDTILPDSLHCFHLGWGIDLASSGLVLLAKQGCFGGGSLDARLEAAYRLYTGWCHTNKKTTGINWWSIKKLDMSSTLDCAFNVKRLFVFFDLRCLKHTHLESCFLFPFFASFQDKRLPNLSWLGELQSLRHGLGCFRGWKFFCEELNLN